MIVNYKGIDIEIVKGDITSVEAEAIVNTSNTKLVMDSEVASAIKKKGGVEIEKEAMAKGPIPVGEVIFTSGGKLDTKYIIHAANMEFDDKKMTDIIKIREATKNSLICAEEHDIKSIALPAMGTGIGEFPTELCAETMINAIKNYIDDAHPKIEKIILVAYNEVCYDDFRLKLKEAKIIS